jgi:hypothetical protein
LDINTGSVLHANEIIVAQRLVKTWIAGADKEWDVIPTEHLRTVFHILTEQNPRLSQREFSKRLSRNGIEVQRKRLPGTDRQSTPVRGLVVTWELSEEDKDMFIDTYFEDNDKRLLAV